jgi:hypothetical protein
LIRITCGTLVSFIFCRLGSVSPVITAFCANWQNNLAALDYVKARRSDSDRPCPDFGSAGASLTLAPVEGRSQAPLDNLQGAERGVAAAPTPVWRRFGCNVDDAAPERNFGDSYGGKGRRCAETGRNRGSEAARGKIGMLE